MTWALDLLSHKSTRSLITIQLTNNYLRPTLESRLLLRNLFDGTPTLECIYSLLPITKWVFQKAAHTLKVRVFFFYFGPKSDVVGFFGGGIVKLKTLFFLAFPPAKVVVGLFSCIRVVLWIICKWKWFTLWNVPLAVCEETTLEFSVAV